MSSLISTCLVTFPSTTSASKAQTKLTLSSGACAFAVLGNPGTISCKITTQRQTAHRQGCIVSSPTKSRLVYLLRYSLLRFIPCLRSEYEGVNHLQRYDYMARTDRAMYRSTKEFMALNLGGASAMALDNGDSPALVLSSLLRRRERNRKLWW